MKRKILVITESKAIRFLLQTVLHEEYTPVTASEAADALYWISQSDLPDAIVLDPILPDTEPWELVEYFKTSGLYQHIPLVVISSMPAEELESLRRQYGADAAFHKPFNPIDLKETITSLIKVSHATERNLLKVV